MQEIRIGRLGEIEGGAALGEQVVGEFPWGHVTPPRRVDPKHVGSERAEQARADRPGDNPSQIEHPQPGRGHHPRRCVANDFAGNERFLANGMPLRVSSPCIERPDRGTNATCRENSVLELFPAERGDRLADRLGERYVHPESFEKRSLMPRVVCVGPHPTICCGPEARKRGELRAGHLPVDRKKPLASTRVRYVTPLKFDRSRYWRLVQGDKGAQRSRNAC